MLNRIFQNCNRLSLLPDGGVVKGKFEHSVRLARQKVSQLIRGCTFFFSITSGPVNQGEFVYREIIDWKFVRDFSDPGECGRDVSIEPFCDCQNRASLEVARIEHHC